MARPGPGQDGAAPRPGAGGLPTRVHDQGSQAREGQDRSATPSPAHRPHAPRARRALDAGVNVGNKQSNCCRGLYFELQSGCHHRTLQEATTPNRSFLGSGI